MKVAKMYFSQAQATNILKVGSSFGEFDNGNVTLLSHGYMSRKSGWLVELSGDIYN